MQRKHRAFTHYWKNDTWDTREVGEPLTHLAGEPIKKRGVGPGDLMYVVTVKQGILFLAGRMSVTEIVSQKIARRRLGQDVWEASDHVLGEGTITRYDRRVPDAIARRLRFEPGHRELVRDAQGRIDQQTLRSVRELTPESAKLLDDVLQSEGAPSEVSASERNSLRVKVADLEAPPPRAQAVITRIVRDTAIVRRLKELHDHRCQRCGTRLDVGPGSGYSEGHHLRPLGSPHDGPDVEANLVILCPNCHAIMDLAVTELKASDIRSHPSHTIGAAFLRYHNRLVARARDEAARR